MSSAAASASRSGSQSASSTVSIPMTAAAGGVSMTQPPASASASYYKIAPDNFVTFGWNLTSLYVQPEFLTIIASCADNGNTYPIGPTDGSQNTVAGSATQIVWNPYQYEAQAGATPLAVATYTLSIWDERGPQATVAGGRLSPYSGMKFAVYRPAAYTALADGWTCATCSSAAAVMSHPAFLAVFATLFVTLLSGWGLLRR